MYNTITRTLTRDKCGATIPVKGLTKRPATREANALGWTHTSTGYHYCPKCKP
jgi:hypothetical protein